MLPELLEIDAQDRQRSAESTSVTVVVPVYNHAPFVQECLESILNTHYPHLEVIIIDDHSPDNADEVIREWLREHTVENFKYIHHERNMGLPSSLNEAIRLAQGRYFCHIAGDDVMLPDGIADRVDYLSNHPDKLAVFSDCHVIDDEGHLLYNSCIEDLYPRIGMRKKYLSVDALIPYCVVFSFSVAGAAFMCRRELFDRVGYYDEQLLIEDWDLYIRVSQIGKLGFCSTYVANFRLHDKNMHKLYFSRPAYTQTVGRILDKHLPTTHGLIKLRLYAKRLSMKLKAEPNRLSRQRLWLSVKMLLIMTKVAYLLLELLAYASQNI